MSHPKFLLLVLLLCSVGVAHAQRGDKKGEVQVTRVPAHTIPPAPALPPQEALKTFRLKPGFKIELVASEPLVEEPIAIAFDPDGRIWVLEMRGFMPNTDGVGERDIPGRVVRLEDSDGDGRMDKKLVFLDGLVMPRALALVRDGVLVAEPPHLWFCRDTDGDGKSDDKTEVAPNYGSQNNPEHTANGLLWALDNWIYSANHAVRYRTIFGRWESQPTTGRGQWGISQDDFGRLFFNANSDQLRADYVPAHYTEGKPGVKLAGLGARVASDQKVYPSRVNPGVNRGYQQGTLRKDGSLASFTAACGPVIYRGDNFPPEFRGNAFVCEPAGNLIKRNILIEKDGAITARNAYPDSEFLTSTDERFRPVNLYTGPDGALYVVDMYHGILQHRMYVTSYLRQQIESRALDKLLHQGRIYRIVAEGGPLSRPRMSQDSPASLVTQLSHPNGWWRDTAQRLLIERADPGVVPLLRQTALTNNNPLARLHALWTLQGLGQLDAKTTESALTDKQPKLRAAALRLSEDLILTNAPETAGLKTKALQLAHDNHADVQVQVALTLGQLNEPAATNLLAQLKQSSTVALARDAASFSLARKAPVVVAPVAAQVQLSPEEQKRFDLGKSMYEATCLACHQPHGLGQEGLAPPLVGSEWVKGPESRLIRLVLHGLHGPVKVKGQTYELDMPSLGVLDDEQIAGALSYVRREWGHNFPMVDPEAVKKVRAATADREQSWTEAELKKIP